MLRDDNRSFPGSYHITRRVVRSWPAIMSCTSSSWETILPHTNHHPFIATAAAPATNRELCKPVTHPLLSLSALSTYCPPPCCFLHCSARPLFRFLTAAQFGGLISLNSPFLLLSSFSGLLLYYCWCLIKSCTRGQTLRITRGLLLLSAAKDGESRKGNNERLHLTVSHYRRKDESPTQIITIITNSLIFI